MRSFNLTTVAATTGALVGAGAFAWLVRTFGEPASTDAPAAAFEGDGAAVGSFVHTRDAGPEHIRDETGERWDAVDQSSDESFPSSDPPANNDFSSPAPIDYAVGEDVPTVTH